MAFTFYAGFDNAIDWVLQIERPDCTTTYYDADLASRFVITLDDDAATTIDSDVVPTAFDTSTSILMGTTTVVVLRIKLGIVPNIPTGTFRMRLVVYSTAYPEGVVWQNNVPIVIKE